MRTDSLLKRYATAALASIVLAGLGTAAKAQELPSYMAPIAGSPAASTAYTATNNVLALNTGMFELYGDAGKIFKQEHSQQASRHPRRCSRARAAGSFSIGRARRRSRRRRCRSSINC